MASYVTASARRADAGSIFSTLPTAATGRPLSARTICTAAVPTAPAAAVIRTRAPNAIRTSSLRGIHAVRKAIGKAAPSAKLALAGSGRSQRRSSCDPLRVTASLTADEAHDALPLKLAGDLRPEDDREARASAGSGRADQHVGEVDPRRADVDDHGAFAGVGRRHVLDDELLGHTGDTEDNCSRQV